MGTGAFDNKVTGGSEVRIGGDCVWIAAFDIGTRQRFPRKVYAPHSGILVYVSQDICQLKRPTKMVRKRFPIGVAHAENAHAQSPDGTGDAIAIKFKLLEAGSPNILARIHFHTVNNCKTVLLAQLKAGNDLRKLLQSDRNIPGIKRVNVPSPRRQQREALRTRRVIVGDVVDLPAKRVHFEDCLPFFAAQETHSEIKGAAACAVSRR